MLRRILGACLLLALAAPAWAQDNEPIDPPRGEKPAPVSKADQSYAIGMNIGRSIKSDDLEVNIEEVIAGLTDAISGKKSRLSDEQLRGAMVALQTEVRERMLNKAKTEGQAFLTANKKKEGVVTLPSGLQYKVIKSGKGESPKATDTVTTHYHGTLVDGTVFDSSKERGEPVNFRVDRVIPGWTEALQKMKVGDVWQLYIPSDLAYGEQGTPDGAIAPNSVLIFDVELLGVGEKEKEAAPPATKKKARE